jgi:hypothetical protein
MFADRARDRAVVPDKARDLITYIHNNPVRAGVAATARDSSWTSHRAYVGLSEPPPWLRVSDGMRRAGFENRADADTWVCTSTKRIDDPDIIELRRKVRRRGALQLATPIVADGSMVPLVVRPFAHIRPDPMRLLELVSETTDVAMERLRSRSRERDVVEARWIAVRAGRASGLAGSDIAAALGISSAAVTMIWRRTCTQRVRDAIEVVCERLEIDAFAAKLKPSLGAQVISKT